MANRCCGRCDPHSYTVAGGSALAIMTIDFFNSTAENSPPICTAYSCLGNICYAASAHLLYLIYFGDLFLNVYVLSRE